MGIFSGQSIFQDLKAQDEIGTMRLIRFLTGSKICNMYQEKHPLQLNRNPVFGL